MQDPVVITAATRTPHGCFQGNLKSLSAPELGGTAIAAALQKSQLKANEIDEVILGCVLSAGQGQAPARQAALSAHLALHTSCTTINKMCGSGMKAVMLAHDLICANSIDIAIAGGMESMTQAPYLLPKAREGYRIGHHQLIDHLFLDGLEDAYEKGRLMGSFAEDTAKAFGLSRELQDEFAITSLKRAQQATREGLFTTEIAPITVVNKKETIEIMADELLQRAHIEKIPHLKPVFDPHGTVTAANASGIADGASTLVLMRASKAREKRLMPLARIVAHTTYSQEPKDFTTAPIYAIEKLMRHINWKAKDVDFFEINEAFAVVALAAMQRLNLSASQLNVHGGACALGHPIGASGARILTTLIHSLKHHKKKRGIAALCIGGGEATAMAIETL